MKSSHYPEISDPMFYKEIRDINEFKKVPKNMEEELDKIFCYKEHQRYLANWFNPKTPYKSMLLFHGLGSGKTLSSIAIAEATHSKKIYILTKNELMQHNYERNLRFGCEKYKIIPPKYIFDTFNNFQNNNTIQNIRKEFKQVKFPDNSVLIVDEAHNVISGDIYQILLNAVNNSKNLKVILLTATPMYDSVEEIWKYLPLLIQGLDPKDLPKSFSIADSIPLINNFFKGIVSYMPTPKVEVANRNDMNIKCKPDDFQKSVLDVLSDKDIEDMQNRLDQVAASLMVYPDGSYGTKEKMGEFLDKKNIYRYSCKLNNLASIIDKTPLKKHVIYSNFVNNSTGSKLIKMFLYYNYPGMKLYYLDNNTSFKNRERIINEFNNTKSCVLVSSPVISEGITLREVESIHIMDAHWNNSRLEQFIGRSIRLNAHMDKDKANVVVYFYSIDGNYIDTIKYNTSVQKMKTINMVEDSLKAISVDCHINHYDCSGEPTGFDENVVKKLNTVADPKIEKHIINSIVIEIETSQKCWIDKNELLDKFIMYIDYLQLSNILSGMNGKVIDNKHFGKVVMFSTQNYVLLSSTRTHMYNSPNTFLLKPDTSKAKVQTLQTVERTKTAKRPVYIPQTDLPIYGKLFDKFGDIDNKLRIVDNTNVFDVSDRRNINLGKDINTFTRKELQDLINLLGIQTKKYKKNELIPVVLDYFIKNKLIVER
jgi:superfamily II DNA or RNA helicase